MKDSKKVSYSNATPGDMLRILGTMKDKKEEYIQEKLNELGCPKNKVIIKPLNTVSRKGRIFVTMPNGINVYA